jgi:hypothetical protein
MLSPRQFGNVVYARLAAGCGDAKSRRELDEELYAPMGGWDAADRRLWTQIHAAPDPD